ncbi:MAG TPA: hypothetical protein PLE60_09515 [Candidatus Latescibacteria bacterium]|nr:hypothetical protein [Candidatus Latescibacterota bacterium]
MVLLVFCAILLLVMAKLTGLVFLLGGWVIKLLAVLAVLIWFLPARRCST